MPRDLPIGNGRVYIAFDRTALLREFHFPYVGEENHAGEPFQIGVWVDNGIHWLPEGWSVRMNYLDDTLVTKIEWESEELGLRIISNDQIHFEENIYLKKITVENLWEEEREIQLFFAHPFQLYGNEIGNTAAYKPESQALVHYKNERYFLINLLANNKFGIDRFATGNLGTWKDAEDGILSGNPIAQGSVDSALAIPLTLPPRGNEVCYYWIAVGKNWEEVDALNRLVKKKTPDVLFKNTADFWNSWANKEKLNDSLLPPKIARLYKRSLLICRTQINECGSIIAAADSDTILYNRDTYGYLWPRDGALVAYGLDLAGYSAAPFFRFCAKLVEKEGYFLHKYSPSGSLGSSWHPWVRDQKPQLPIQEDETALVLWSLWNHYQCFRDLELIRSLYVPLIKKAADFMMNYIDRKTGLPLVSYDLWEERQGVFSFTAAAVHGGLMAAARFAALFGEEELSLEYAEGAASLRRAMEKYLYLPEKKRFARMVISKKDGSIEVDPTLDASLYGLFAFGAFEPDDPRVKETLRQVFSALEVNGGIIRYEGDPFYRDPESSISNPWFVTTLWKAQYLIAKAKTKEELDEALLIFEWVHDHALESGVLAEQIDPQTNAPTSVSPLTWSHGTFIAAVQEYLNKRMAIDRCPACGGSKTSKRGSE